MFERIFNAEIYKQYSKKTAFIIPGIVFLISLLFPYLLLAKFHEFTMYDPDFFIDDSSASAIGFTIDFVLIFIYVSAVMILYFFVTIVIPIVIPISIYGQDYSNRVIANTISSGVKRHHIFWAKFLISLVHCILYYLVYIVGTLLSLGIFVLVYDIDLSSFVYGISEIEIDWVLGSIMILNSLLSVVLSIIISIFAIIITKNIVGAIFTTFALKVFFNFILTSLFTLMFLAVSISIYPNEDWYYLGQLIYKLTIVPLLLLISVNIFMKTEY